MKKIGVLILLSLLFISFVYAQNGEAEMPESPVNDSIIQGAEKVTEALPLGPDGKIDYAKLNQTKSLAEARIEGINIWLDENVYWLKIIFQMRPEISWLFFLNLYWMLLFLVNIVLNAPHRIIFSWMSDSKTLRQFVGLGIFLIMLLSGFILGLARLEYNLFWSSPLKIAIAITIMIFAYLLLNVETKWEGEKVEESEKEGMKEDIQDLEKEGEKSKKKKGEKLTEEEEEEVEEEAKEALEGAGDESNF